MSNHEPTKVIHMIPSYSILCIDLRLYDLLYVNLIRFHQRNFQKPAIRDTTWEVRGFIHQILGKGVVLLAFVLTHWQNKWVYS